MPGPLGTLIVVVLKARNLPNKQRIGKQDPYATCTYLSHRKRTKTDKRGGQHPVWDDELRFEIYENIKDAMSTASVSTTASGGVVPVKNGSGASSDPSLGAGGGLGVKALRVAVYADDPRDPELIGEGSVDLTDTLKKGEFDDWVIITNKGKYQGEVYLEMTFYSAKAPPVRKQNIKTARAGVFEAGSPATRKPASPLGPSPAGSAVKHQAPLRSASLDLSTVPAALKVGGGSPQTGTALPPGGLPLPGDSVQEEPLRRSSFGGITNQVDQAQPYDEVGALVQPMTATSLQEKPLPPPSNGQLPLPSLRPHRHSVGSFAYEDLSVRVPTPEQTAGRPGLSPLAVPHQSTSAPPGELPGYQNQGAPLTAQDITPTHQAPHHWQPVEPHGYSGATSLRQSQGRRPLPMPEPRPASAYSQYPPTSGSQPAPMEPERAPSGAYTAYPPPSGYPGPHIISPVQAPSPGGQQLTNQPGWGPELSAQPPSQPLPPFPVEQSQPGQQQHPSSQSQYISNEATFAPLPAGHHLSTFPPSANPRYTHQMSLPPPPPGQTPVPLQQVLRAGTPLPPPPVGQQPYLPGSAQPSYGYSAAPSLTGNAVALPTSMYSNTPPPAFPVHSAPQPAPTPVPYRQQASTPLPPPPPGAVPMGHYGIAQGQPQAPLQQPPLAQGPSVNGTYYTGQAQPPPVSMYQYHPGLAAPHYLPPQGDTPMMPTQQLPPVQQPYSAPQPGWGY